MLNVKCYRMAVFESMIDWAYCPGLAPTVDVVIQDVKGCGVAGNTLSLHETPKRSLQGSIVQGDGLAWIRRMFWVRQSSANHKQYAWQIHFVFC